MDVSLRTWLVGLADRFEQAQLSFGHTTDNAWDEAVALSLGALQWPDEASLLDKKLTAAQLEELEQLALRRINDRVPLPLLLGRAQFAGLEFLTAPNVMIPRSPIAELVRGRFHPWLSKAPMRVLDVCCGGGCIGISIADEFANTDVVISDVDEAALLLAAKNVELHGMQERVQVLHSDMYARLQGQTFDLIVSNPPYVPTAESDLRPPEFMHEPGLAYDGGADGLVFVRKLLAGANALLSETGLLVIEVGQWRDEVEATWPRVPFVWPELVQGGEGVLVLEAGVVAEHTARSGW